MLLLASSVCPLMDEAAKRFMSASWWMGKAGSCSGVRALLSKALIQLSADGWGWTLSLVVVWSSPGICGLYGRLNGELQETLCQGGPSSAPVPVVSPCRSTLPQEALPTLVGSFGSVSSVVTAPVLWVLVHAKFCLCLPSLESLFLSVVWKACNQILLALKARFPGDFQSLCWIPRLGNLMGSEPSQQCENFFGITVLQSVDHPPSGYGIWFLSWLCPSYHITVASLSLDGGIFLVGSSVLLLLVVPTAGCSFGVLAGELSTRLYSTVLNWKLYQF